MANSIAPNIEDGDLPKFFLSGMFSDFEIRHNVYTFKVHKIVVCAKSLYFEKLCGADFKEGRQGYSSLDEDDDPFMIARMLLTMYSGDYTKANASEVLRRMLRNASAQKNSTIPMRSEGCLDPYVDTYVTHAKMYALGDKYQFASLVELARSKFVAAIDDQDFDLEDLVAAIDIIYSTTPDTDYGLRKHVVYRAQNNIQQLKQMPSFKEVFENHVGFCWDLATEYKARKNVWCVGCKQESKLPVTCTCGFHGFCGGLKACKELDWGTLKCSHCKRVGQIIRDQPVDDDEVVLILTPKTQSAPTSPSTMEAPATRGKKRKSF